MDYRLLNEIANNARMPLVDLAGILDCSSTDVKYRINNLIKKETFVNNGMGKTQDTFSGD